MYYIIPSLLFLLIVVTYIFVLNYIIEGITYIINQVYSWKGVFGFIIRDLIVGIIFLILTTLSMMSLIGNKFYILMDFIPFIIGGVPIIIVGLITGGIYYYLSWMINFLLFLLPMYILYKNEKFEIGQIYLKSYLILHVTIGLLIMLGVSSA